MTTGVSIGASADALRVSYVAETAYGTTPATPSFSNLRVTSEGLVAADTFQESAELTPHGNVTDTFLTGSMAQGPIAFELTDGTFEAWLAAMLRSDWDGSPDDVLRNGIAPTSFTVENSSLYQRFTGMIPNTMSLAFSAGEKVTGSFDLMGSAVSTATTAISGATYTAANQERPLNGTSDFSGLAFMGLSPTPKIRSVNLSVQSNLREQRELGRLGPAGYGLGKFRVTAEMEIYFDSWTLYEAWRAQTAGGLSWRVGTEAGKRYDFEIGRGKLTNATVTAGGENTDVMVNATYQGLYNQSGSPAENCTLKITRNV